ncbi:MAG: hypothetical protein IJJ74_08010 [Eubacterium sp.]|nr:hypothetical protein [Eubacterium sp.]
MRKKILTGAMTLALLAAVGCGKKDDEVDGVSKRTTSVVTGATTEAATTEATTTTTTEASTEASTQTNTQELKDWDVSNEEGMLSFLDGTWDMIPTGTATTTNKGALLTFKKDESFVEIANENNGVYAYVYMGFDRLFPNMEDDTNFIEMQVDYSSSESIRVDSRATVQILTAITDKGEVMALRESGNGQSEIAMYALDYEKTAFDYFWVFKKENDNFIMTREQNDSLRIKDGNFYAIKWYDCGNGVNLQPVDVIETEEDWYGEKIHAVSYIRSKTYPKSIYAPFYEIEGMEQYANSGGYGPALCKVETNSQGVVTKITNISYLGYGYYNADLTY